MRGPTLALAAGSESEPVQAVRLGRGAQGGPTAVARTRWRDPDDTAPSSSRVAREITGYRTFCPLQRLLKANQGGITEQHILAADKLREAHDVSQIGFSAGRDGLLPVTAASYGPRGGPSAAAMAQLAAWRDFRRAMLLFSAQQQRLILHVILLNWTIPAWCRHESKRLGVTLDQKAQQGGLVAILDVLAVHFKTDIEQDVASGRRLPA